MNMHSKHILLLLIMLFAISTASPVSAAKEDTHTTYYVSPHGHDWDTGLNWDHSRRTINGTVDLLAPGDTIMVAKGTYKEYIKIDKNITLIGVNHPTLTYKEQGEDITIYGGNVTINGFIITKRGIDIYSYSTVDIINCEFSHVDCGAIGNCGVLHVYNCSFHDCVAHAGAVISNCGASVYNPQGVFYLIHCTITNCYSVYKIPGIIGNAGVGYWDKYTRDHTSLPPHKRLLDWRDNPLREI